LPSFTLRLCRRNQPPILTLSSPQFANKLAPEGLVICVTSVPSAFTTKSCLDPRDADLRREYDLMPIG
jgi:hypothetical protein